MCTVRRDRQTATGKGERRRTRRRDHRARDARRRGPHVPRQRARDEECSERCDHRDHPPHTHATTGVWLGRRRQRSRSSTCSNPFELTFDVSRGLPPLVWVLRQARLHQVLECGWCQRLADRERRWFGVEHTRDDAGPALAWKRPTAGQHLVDHRSERKEIAARIGASSLKLLGRHVLQRTEQRAFIRQRCGHGRRRGSGSNRFRDPEIQ